MAKALTLLFASNKWNYGLSERALTEGLRTHPAERNDRYVNAKVEFESSIIIRPYNGILQ
jgi:hypothetical protein